MKDAPLTILLVEDDPAHAEIARRTLEGCRVPIRLIHLEDGQATLDYLQRAGALADAAPRPRPHLILLDLRLPKVDGLEVLQRIKADVALKTIPVVVLTTSHAEADVAAAYANHASGYLVKPLDFEQFVNLMETFGDYWLAGNRYPGAR